MKANYLGKKRGSILDSALGALTDNFRSIDLTLYELRPRLDEEFTTIIEMINTILVTVESAIFDDIDFPLDSTKSK